MAGDDDATVRAVQAQVRAELAQARLRQRTLESMRSEAGDTAQRLTDFAALAQRASQRLTSMDRAAQREVLALLDVRVTVTCDGDVAAPHVRIEGRIDPGLFASRGALQEAPGPGTQDVGDHGADRVFGRGHPGVHGRPNSPRETGEETLEEIHVSTQIGRAMVGATERGTVDAAQPCGSMRGRLIRRCYAEAVRGCCSSRGVVRGGRRPGR